MGVYKVFIWKIIILLILKAFIIHWRLKMNLKLLVKRLEEYASLKVDSIKM
jgi:hypothetical protein